MTLVLESIPEGTQPVKHIRRPGVFAPDGEDKALLESNLSAPSGPSGVSTPLVIPSPDGLKAINSSSTDPEAASHTSLQSSSDSSSSSSPASVGLSLRYVNCDTPEIIGIVKAYREHCSKLEHSPCTFLHLRHTEDGSTALYRVNACSCSRYFQQGRAQMIRTMSQRLSDGQMSGVFFTLTVDAKRYGLTDAWPSMWPQFKRCKDALNIYRKRHMNASGSIRYLAALEQCKSGYPHLHVYCPGLRWLIKEQDLGKMDEWWGMGSANTQKERRQDSARGYILKYISKLDGWSEVSLALIWHFRIRIYNLSRKYYARHPESEWELLGTYRDAEALSEGLGIGFRAAEALIEAWADIEDNLIHLS